jgi:predicted GNAT family N-acyltransferase
LKSNNAIHQSRRQDYSCNALITRRPGDGKRYSVPVNLRPIQFDSTDYQAAFHLRQQVLRAPLGSNLADENLEAEREQQHFGLFDDNEVLLACVIAAPLAPAHMKLRQMAVATEYQRQGLGWTLLSGVEAILLGGGVTTLTLHARWSAVGFYRRLGYSTHGERFIEIGLPHVAMGK